MSVKKEPSFPSNIGALRNCENPIGGCHFGEGCGNDPAALAGGSEGCMGPSTSLQSARPSGKDRESFSYEVSFFFTLFFFIEFSEFHRADGDLLFITSDSFLSWHPIFWELD